MFLQYSIIAAILLPSTRMVDASESRLQPVVSGSLDVATNFFVDLSRRFILAVGAHDQLDNLDIPTLSKMEASAIPVYLSTNWDELILVKIGVIVCVMVGILFLVFVPFVGFIFCCCRCCCDKCGGAEKRPKKRLARRRICQTFLMLFVLVTLACLAFSFLSAWYLNKNLKTVVSPNDKDNLVLDELNRTSALIGQTLDAFATDATSAVSGIAADIGTEIIRSGGDTAVAVRTKLTSSTIDGLLSQGGASLTGFLETGKDLATLVNVTAELKADDLAVAVDDLMVTLNDAGCATGDAATFCAQVKADAILYEAALNNVSAVLPEINASIDAVDKTGATELAREADAANKKINDVATMVENEVNKKNKTLSDLATKSEGNIQNKTDDLIKDFRKTTKALVDGAVDYFSLQSQDSSYIDNITDYFDMAMYCMFALAGLAALLQLLLVFAWLCGCCSRNTGAGCNLAFVGLYFITCDLFMVLVLIVYNPLAVVYTEGCHRILHPSSTPHPLYDSVYNAIISPNGSISSSLYQCSLDAPISRVLSEAGFDANKLVDAEAVNLDELIPDLNATLKDVKGDASVAAKSQIDGSVAVMVAALSGVENNTLEATATAASRAFSSFDEAARGLNLSVLASALESAAEGAQNDSKTELATNLTRAATEITRLANADHVNGVVLTDVARAEASLTRLKMGKTMATNATSIIADLSTTASTFLADVSAIVDTEVDAFRRRIEDVLSRAVSGFLDASNSTATCGKIWQTVTTLAGVPCTLIVDPLAAYFFGLGAHVGLGFVAVIFAVHVAGMWREEKAFKEEGPRSGREKIRDNRVSPVSPDEELTIKVVKTKNRKTTNPPPPTKTTAKTTTKTTPKSKPKLPKERPVPAKTSRRISPEPAPQPRRQAPTASYDDRYDQYDPYGQYDGYDPYDPYNYPQPPGMNSHRPGMMVQAGHGYQEHGYY